MQSHWSLLEGNGVGVREGDVMTDTETEEMHYKDGVNSHWKLKEAWKCFSSTEHPEGTVLLKP